MTRKPISARRVAAPVSRDTSADAERPILTVIRGDVLSAAERRIRDLDDALDGEPEDEPGAHELPPPVAHTVAHTEAPHAVGPVVGKFERFDDFTGTDRVVYRYMSEAREAFLGNYPDFGADPKIERMILRAWKAIEARRAEIRRRRAMTVR